MAPAPADGCVLTMGPFLQCLLPSEWPAPPLPTPPPTPACLAAWLCIRQRPVISGWQGSPAVCAQLGRPAELRVGGMKGSPVQGPGKEWEDVQIWGM